MKEFLKKLLVPLLTSRQVSAIADQFFDNKTPIFVLHRISEPGADEKGKINSDHLRQCLDYLHEHNYTLISLEDLILSLLDNKKLPPNSIVFTMDDGYTDQAEIAAPIFLEYNCPLTFFVITGMLDQSLWPWDAQASWVIESSEDTALASSTTIKSLGLEYNGNISKRIFRRELQNTLKSVDADKIFNILQNIASEVGITIPNTAPPGHQSMNWDMARKLEKQGIRFAPHSTSHHILSKTCKQDVVLEIEQSWSTVCTELKNPLKVFCYPNGRSIDFGDREIEILKSSDFLGAVSLTSDFINNKKHIANHQVYSLPRIALPDNMIDFIQYCSWIESAKSL